MTAPLGDAFITAHADTSELAPEMIAGTRRAAEEAEAATRDDFVELGHRTGETTGDEFGRSFVRDASGRLRDARTGRFAQDAENLGRSVGARIGNSAGDEAEKTLGSKIGNFGKLLAPKWIQSIGVWIAILGPPVLELVGTLAPAVGVLAEIIPVALGGAAALGVLKLSMLGVSQAIKDIGTPKFAKDLKGLAPSARDFVSAIAGVKPELKGIQQSVQQAFFANGFAPLINTLAKTLLPRIGHELNYLASTLGGTVADFGRMFAQTANANLLLITLENFTTALGRAGKAIVPIVHALLTIGQVASGSLLQKLVAGFGNIATSFDSFITDAGKTGRLQKFFDSTYTALHQIVVIGEDVWNILSGILGAAAASGGGGAIIGVLSTIATIITGLNKSGALTEVFTVFNEFFGVLAQAIGPLIGPVSQLILLLGKDLAGDLKTLTPTLLSLVNNGIIPLLGLITASLPAVNAFVLAIIKLLNFVSSNATVVTGVFAAMAGWFIGVQAANLVGSIVAITGAFNDWIVAALGLDVALDANPIGLIVIAIAGAVTLTVGLIGLIVLLQKRFDIFGKIGHFFVFLYKDVAKFVEGVASAIGTFFTSTVPGWWDSFKAWFSALPGRITTAVHGAVDALLQGVGFLIGSALAILLKGPQTLFEELLTWGPKIIAWARALPDQIATAIGDFGGLLWNIFITNGLNKVLAGIMAIGNTILTFISTTFTKSVDYVSSHISEIVGFLASLPGKILALGPKMLAAGQSLVTSLFRGLVSVGSKVGGFADAIANHIKDAINSLIGEINKGINSVGKHIPGGLPNIPALASGAYVTSPTLALIGERNPEVVLPTDNPRRAATLLQQSGLASVLNMGTPAFNVTVKIGERDITDIVDTQIDQANAATAAALNFGPRGS